MQAGSATLKISLELRYVPQKGHNLPKVGWAQPLTSLTLSAKRSTLQGSFITHNYPYLGKSAFSLLASGTPKVKPIIGGFGIEGLHEAFDQMHSMVGREKCLKTNLNGLRFKR